MPIANTANNIVVLINLGGPATLDEVRPFLTSLFKDPAILRLPMPWRGLLANFIAWRRTPIAQQIYRQLGGGSPILANTQAQAKALQAVLNERYPAALWRVEVAMQHSIPRIDDVLRQVRASDATNIYILPLYPQFSTTTTGSALRVVDEVIGSDVRRRDICCYPAIAGFIKAMAEKIAPVMQQAEEYGAPRLLLSAHGLPEKIVKAGDPYAVQCERTAAALRASLGLDDEQAVLCYQSRVGPLKWIGPSTDDEIIRAAHESRPIVIAPVAFVSEHSETIVEIDREYRHLAISSGAPWFGYTGTVGVHDLFINSLADMISGSCELTDNNRTDEESLEQGDRGCRGCRGANRLCRGCDFTDRSANCRKP